MRKTNFLISFLLFSSTLSVLTASEPGLVAHYKMNGNLKDSSGKNNHLKTAEKELIFTKNRQFKEQPDNVVFGPTKKTGFTGASCESMVLDPQQGVTLSGYFLKRGGNNFSSTLFGFGSQKWNEPGLFLGLPYGVVFVKAHQTKSKRYQRLKEGYWHHIALVVPENESGTATYQLYVDGKLVQEGNYEHKPGLFKQFTLGKITGKQAQGYALDEVKIYNRPLTAEEISNAAAKNPKAKPVIKLQNYSTRHVPPAKGTVKLAGELQVRFLTKDWICVVGDYNDFLTKRFVAECGKFLKNVDQSDQVAQWSKNFHYKFAFCELATLYRPQILKKFESKENFSIKSKGKSIGISELGYWGNAIGQMRVPVISTGKPKRTSGAALAHFAFLKLATPLQNGQHYTLTTNDGEKVKFTYNDQKDYSWLIKVNQIGYVPDAGKKFAYLGGWLGSKGALDLAAWEGKPFYLINESGNKVFTGTICLRMKDIKLKDKVPFNGEDVYEMDFSSFSKPGQYQVYIPGIGCSWKFKISNDTIGEAFYTHTRGLYHKRCGIAKEKPYTNWTSGDCHKQSYAGGFPPNSKHYSKPKKGHEGGIMDKAGNYIQHNSFKVIKETKTDNVLPNVWGGWHDAADYDRRTYHFQVVRDLLAAYLMFPEKFKDGQLNIPESGNGIPDIIDEAAWGVDVWRRAQNDKGGVGCWLEATSHPHDPNPHTDKQRYYLALPTRESTIDYAAHAAMLALAYKQCGAQEKSNLFLKSAIKAYNYAMDPENTADHSWSATDQRWKDGKKTSKTKTYRYKEPEKLPEDRWFKAACDLYLLTGNSDYKSDMAKCEKTFKYNVNSISWKQHPFYFIELLVYPEKLPEYSDILSMGILKVADQALKIQDQYAYRNYWWKPDHGYVRFMAWGNIIPLRRARIFVAAYRISKDKKYRDAALLCNDWQNGCNPMGRSLTSGLGKVYPVRFLDLPSYSDGIAEFVPGITPYHLTGGTAYGQRIYVSGLFMNKRDDHGFKGANVCLLPKSMTNGKNLDLKEISHVLEKHYPLFRRYTNIEGLEVAQNEYTVWETISPSAAVTACLIEDGWMPSEELKNKQPAKSIKELHGYIAQP